MSKTICFYSHIPCAIHNNDIYTSSFIGRYLDSLFENNGSLIIASHTDNYDPTFYDYKLKSKKIKLINIGKKTSSISRFFFGFIFLFELIKFRNKIDHFVIRVPTPLSLWFKILIKNSKLHFLVVANELEAAQQKIIYSFRDLLVKYFNIFSDKILFHSHKNTNSFVNSKALLIKYKLYNPSLVSTSNIIDSDFSPKLIFSINDPIKLLYVGRIDLSKGILETLQAVKLLLDKKIYCTYDIVGWDDDTNSRNLKTILNLVDKLNLNNVVNFLGKKSQGSELNNYYRKSDIYIIASHHESFPRTILECMANSTIVIASRVGAIPFELSNNENVILIDPHNIDNIVDSVIKISLNQNLRTHIITNAYNLAKTKNVLSSTKKLINNLK